MFAIKAKITKFIDYSQPGWVEVEFTDVFNRKHIFKEKVPGVTEKYLDENSDYPLDGIIACEIIERSEDSIKVTTEKPWYIESINGEMIFEISPDQLIEFDHLGK